MLKKGDIVNVYHDPFTCQNQEGSAKLLKDLQTRGFKQEYWEVEFLSDGFITDRWINNDVN